MAIPFVRYTYTDAVANDVTAARLNNSEQGIKDAHYQPAVAVTHNAAQTLTTAVALALAFNTERFDQAGNAADTMHDTVTNNSRLTCRYAGVYQISGCIEFVANATGSRLLDIRVNGATIICRARIVAGASDNHGLVVSRIYALAVNDYVELVATQTSGGNLNVNSSANYSPEFMMARVG